MSSNRNAHLVNTGTDLRIPDNHNDASGDSNPYAYPYFRASTTNHCMTSVYDLIVRFDSLWRDYVGENDAFVERLISQIQDRVRNAPREALWKDSCGDTALHRLAQGARFPVSADPHVMAKAEYLVQVAEALILADKTITTSQNNWKETPLHQFSQHCGFPSELVETANETTIPVLTTMENPMMEFFLLLGRHGAASVVNIWKSYPLHNACELLGVSDKEVEGLPHMVTNPLLEWMHEQQCKMIQQLIMANPNALWANDDSHNMPIHRAVISMKCGPDVLRILLQRLLEGNQSILAENQLHLADSEDDTIGHVTRLAGRSLPEIYYKSFSGRLATKIQFMLDDNHDAESLASCIGSLWEKTLLFVQADSMGTLDPIPFSFTHAAIRLKIPYCAIMLAVNLHPEELCQLDNKGRTPLVLALENKMKNYYGQPLLELLLKKQPSAASIADHQGRLPLHLALAQECSYYLSWDEGIKSIFASEPRAVSARDPLTKLYPFMMAAVNDRGNPTTTFELLRSDPAVITFC